MKQHLPAQPAPLTPYDAATRVVAGFSTTRLRARIDGWTPERQRMFCEALADSGIVREAAAAVGMSKESAYQLRRKAEGKGFALAWDAALVLARQRLMDIALERAIDGNKDILIKDGEVVGERKKQDVRHLLAAIGRMAAIQRSDTMARSIAVEFDAFLDCMEAEAAGSQGRTAAFVEARTPDGHFARKDHEKTLDSMRRNDRFVATARPKLSLDDYTQEDLDGWDEILAWEAEDRAAGRIPAIYGPSPDEDGNTQT
jgi:hypothetical protein